MVPKVYPWSLAWTCARRISLKYTITKISHPNSDDYTVFKPLICLANCVRERPYFTTALVVNFTLNIYILLVISLKTMYFVESRELVKRLAKYVLYKGAFLALIVPPTLTHAGLWSTWLTVVCTLKSFEALARDRLERMNASFSTTPLNYFRVYCVLLVVFIADVVWIMMCLLIDGTEPWSLLLLLTFEPLGIASETLTRGHFGSWI